MSHSSLTANCEHINFNNDSFCSGFASTFLSMLFITDLLTPNLLPNSS
nr:MAG TPA: hypothetical protein [Caudoviricetes sp.]